MQNLKIPGKDADRVHSDQLALSVPTNCGQWWEALSFIQPGRLHWANPQWPAANQNHVWSKACPLKGAAVPPRRQKAGLGGQNSLGYYNGLWPPIDMLYICGMKIS